MTMVVDEGGFDFLPIERLHFIKQQHRC